MIRSLLIWQHCGMDLNNTWQRHSAPTYQDQSANSGWKFSDLHAEDMDFLKSQYLPSELSRNGVTKCVLWTWNITTEIDNTTCVTIWELHVHLFSQFILSGLNCAFWTKVYDIQHQTMQYIIERTGSDLIFKRAHYLNKIHMCEDDPVGEEIAFSLVLI